MKVFSKREIVSENTAFRTSWSARRSWRKPVITLIIERLFGTDSESKVAIGHDPRRLGSFLELDRVAIGRFRRTNTKSPFGAFCVV